MGAPLSSPAPVNTPVVPRITPVGDATATPRRVETATPPPAPTTWQRRGLAGETAEAVAVDPANPSVVYAGGARLARSSDGGRTWQPLREVQSLRGLMALPGALLVAASDGCARGTTAPALRTDDSGATWREIGQNFRDLAATPDGSVLYAAGCPGILRSEDGGRTWQRASSPNSEGWAVAVSPAKPSVVWGAFVSEGGSVRLQRSTDAGRTWADLPSPDDLWAPALLAPHPQQADTLALTSRNGLWQTIDGGKTWTQLEQGLESARREEGGTRLYDFAGLLALPDRLVVATASAGVYVRSGTAAFTRLPGSVPTTSDLALQRTDPPSLIAATADGVYAFLLR